MKFRPVEAALFYADRQTDGRRDLTKLIVAFRNFVNAPKKAISSCDIEHNKNYLNLFVKKVNRPANKHKLGIFRQGIPVMFKYTCK